MISSSSIGWFLRQELQHVNYYTISSNHRPKSFTFSKDPLRLLCGSFTVTTWGHSSLWTTLERKTICTLLQSSSRPMSPYSFYPIAPEGALKCFLYLLLSCNLVTVVRSYENYPCFYRSEIYFTSYH